MQRKRGLGTESMLGSLAFLRHSPAKSCPGKITHGAVWFSGIMQWLWDKGPAPTGLSDSTACGMSDRRKSGTGVVMVRRPGHMGYVQRKSSCMPQGRRVLPPLQGRVRIVRQARFGLITCSERLPLPTRFFLSIHGVLNAGACLGMSVSFKATTCFVSE
ncbi:hypothetical protein F4861DRAFT_163057 [Xylaria intraflava]|nr:hypothetical protein F4861DRAFT_163057 [Xylaria intraflava]